MFCPIATWTPGSLSPLPTRKAEKRDLWSRLTQSYSILSCLTSFQVTTDNEAEFFISLHGAGDGELKVYGEAPYGHFPVDLLQSPKEKDTYIVRYTPRGVGEHKIHINFAGEPVKGSPYIVKVRHSKHARRSLVCSSRPVPSRPGPLEVQKPTIIVWFQRTDLKKWRESKKKTWTDKDYAIGCRLQYGTNGNKRRSHLRGSALIVSRYIFVSYLTTRRPKIKWRHWTFFIIFFYTRWQIPVRSPWKLISWSAHLSASQCVTRWIYLCRCLALLERAS